MQTTSIDQVAGIVSLTTVLAHASGEWIASDWPVCAISETTTPHRMGAALTYARRYALFTLVITGEDDLDAPDLTTPITRTSAPEKPSGIGNARLNGGGFGIAPRRAGDPKPVKPVLAPEASAELTDRLLVELNNLRSADDAAMWAHRSLGDKNRLTAPDAQRVEEAFQGRLGTLWSLPLQTTLRRHQSARQRRGAALVNGMKQNAGLGGGQRSSTRAC